MDNGRKRNWIYCIRGLAIIAVVVCHQQEVLHESEYIQLVSLYSVTTLVFLMGLTKAFSIFKHSREVGDSMLRYTLRSMAPTLITYAFANFVYLYIAIGRVDLAECWTSMLTFSTSGPFYYIRYYIILSILAPVLYAFSRRLLLSGRNEGTGGKAPIPRWGCRSTATIVYLFALWMIGYYTTGSFNLLASTYLSIYTAGLCIGIHITEGAVGYPKRVLLPLGVVCLVSGLILTYDFYFALVAGNEHYTGGLSYFFPKLQINPPNPAIVLYSAGVVICAFFGFKWLEKKGLTMLWKPFYTLGKYSLDIFLWHLLVRDKLTYYIFQLEIELRSNIFKNILYYAVMFSVPILYRVILNRLKAFAYRELKAVR